MISTRAHGSGERLPGESPDLDLPPEEERPRAMAMEGGGVGGRELRGLTAGAEKRGVRGERCGEQR